MAYNTVIWQGSFIGSGFTEVLDFPSGVDWIEVYNYTNIATNEASEGYAFYWQRGFVDGTALEYEANAGHNAVDLTSVTIGGIYPLNWQLQTVGPFIATTNITNATQPVISTGNTGNLIGTSNGDVVRILANTSNPNLSGYDFAITTVVSNTSFTILPVLANAPGGGGGTGLYAPVIYPPFFYPTNLRVVNISNAAQAIVTTSIYHRYIVGQAIRFHVPKVFGMIEIDQLIGNIVAIVDGVNFVVDIDTTAFSTFVFPVVPVKAFTPASVVPVGEETDANSNPNLLDDATDNVGILGLALVSGANAPAGEGDDLIFWKAGKSFNT